MNNFTKVSLLTLFVTTFTLFMGWVTIGVLIPQVLFLLYAVATHPNVFISRTLVLYYLFFAYQLVSDIHSGSGYDITIWVARFLVVAVPLIISAVLFSPKNIKNCDGVAKYALVVSFITIMLSIRVLIDDGEAIRLCSMANSTGDTDVYYSYWRQGLANYDTAAMILFMPVVLISGLKSKMRGNRIWMWWIGIGLALTFMYLGQVTTTFVLCLMVTLMSFLNVKSKIITYAGISLATVILLTQLSGLLDSAVALTEGTAMNERFTSLSSAAQGQSFDDSSDAGVRWTLISSTIESFLSHPIFGSPDALTGGHNYFLDMLAKYGIIGCLPFFMMIRTQFRIISSYLSKNSRHYYLIILIGFIVLGIIKNMSGTEYWNYLFIYYPAILFWIDSNNKQLTT